MGIGGQRQAPAALPQGKSRYPLYRRLSGPQGRCGRVRKISPPPGFGPRTVQPVASRYTDWAIPVHPLWQYRGKFVPYIRSWYVGERMFCSQQFYLGTVWPQIFSLKPWPLHPGIRWRGLAASQSLPGHLTLLRSETRFHCRPARRPLTKLSYTNA
jgi:hypothetical protein